MENGIHCSLVFMILANSEIPPFRLKEPRAHKGHRCRSIMVRAYITSESILRPIWLGRLTAACNLPNSTVIFIHYLRRSQLSIRDLTNIYECLSTVSNQSVMCWHEYQFGSYPELKETSVFSNFCNPATGVKIHRRPKITHYMIRLFK